jgi:Uma2 family endonuclease
MGASITRRMHLISLEQKQNFLPLCPDFVVEIRSPSDRLSIVQAKMQEYVDNGTRLGWLIDPHGRAVYVYRPNQSVERLENPATLSGDPVLPGFILDLQKIWEPDFYSDFRANVRHNRNDGTSCVHPMA